MNCYAKDLKPGYKVNFHERGWIEVLSVDRNRTAARKATNCPCVRDLKIMLLDNVTGEVWIEECNAHALFVAVDA